MGHSFKDKDHIETKTGGRSSHMTCLAPASNEQSMQDN